MRKTRVFLINGAGKNGHSHAKQGNWKPLTKISSNCMNKLNVTSKTLNSFKTT